MNNQVSILGCGWLGLPLASELIKIGYVIKGSTTQLEKFEHLKKHDIIPFKINLSDDGITGDISDFLDNSSILIINIPPGLRKNPNLNYVEQMDLLQSKISLSKIEKVLYVSSTSVYEDQASLPIYTESDPPNGTSNSAQQLIKVEQDFMDNPNFRTTIVRFGGLIGNERNPAKFLSGRSHVSDPNGPVNLIHLEDCLGILKSILHLNLWNQVFNAVTPQHPSRASFYTKNCHSENLPVPEFDYRTPSVGKTVNSKNVFSLLQYTFQHPL